jgi:hypothetical protein
MTGPRDTPPEYGVLVSSETGMPLTQRQRAHLQAIREAVEPLYEAMHNAEGSTMPGEHQEHTWSSRRMSIAATHIETALMFIRRAALESA